VVGGVAGDDIAEAGFHTHADEGEQAAVLPLAGHLELGVAELHAALVERVGGVRGRHVHRHVEVVAAGFERGIEDGRVEARVAGVDDHVGLRRPCQLDEIERVGGVGAGAHHVR
jgi:hypothetical protein